MFPKFTNTTNVQRMAKEQIERRSVDLHHPLDQHKHPFIIKREGFNTTIGKINGLELSAYYF
jgi:hypothetical protein